MNQNTKRVLLRTGLLIVTFLLALGSNIHAQFSIDLSGHVSSTPLTGAVIQWHNGTPVSAANQLTPPQVLAAPAGTYYAVYHDSVNSCYSPEARVVTVTNICPSQTVDLTTRANSPPVGAIVQWFTNSTHSGTAYTTPSTAMSGTYYAFFYDSVNNCYSPASDPVIVFTGSCVTPDTVQITPPCTGCPVTACVVADDIDTTGGGVSYTACSAPVGYTQTGPDANGCVTITALPGTTTGGQSCVVACKNGVCDTTLIDVLPPVTPDTLFTRGQCDTCTAIQVCPTANDLPSGPGTISYSSCGLVPSGFGSQNMNPTTGCLTFTGNGTQGVNDTLTTCIVACKNGICDTSYVSILPPVQTDSIISVVPSCGTCPTTPICPTANDLMTTSGITYASCGLDSVELNQGSITIDSNGCVIWTPNGNQVDTITTCVIACAGGLCDTTYISIPSTLSPLPVVLNDFKLFKDDCDVDLYWSTLSEKTTSHFNVMRKSQHDAFYSKLAEVEAQGNSSQLVQYRYSDVDLGNAQYEYKLQIVDIDQNVSETISKSVKINCNKGSIQVFPNPASDVLNIRIDTDDDALYDIELSDLSGRVIKKANRFIHVGGVEMIRLPLQSIANGIYQVSIKRNNAHPEIIKVHISH